MPNTINAIYAIWFYSKDNLKSSFWREMTYSKETLFNVSSSLNGIFDVINELFIVVSEISKYTNILPLSSRMNGSK